MENLLWFAYSAGYLSVAIIFLLLAKFIFDLFTPYSVKRQLMEKDNPAAGIVLAGFIIGVSAVICVVFKGDGPETPTLQVFIDEIVEVVVYGVISLVLLFVAGVINDKIILSKFSNRNEIIDKRNMSVSMIVCASYIGSGLIIAGGVNGSLDIISMIVTFAAGQVALVIFSKLYQIATSYDDQKELGENRNIAVGLAFGGNILAFSLILMKGLSINTQFVTEWSWLDRLAHLGYYAIAGCVLLIIVRAINNRLFFPKTNITKEIVQDNNINAGLIEATLAISMGAAMVFSL